MVIAAGDLFDKCSEHDVLGLEVLLVVLLLACACLAVLVVADEEDLVDVHLPLFYHLNM